MLRRFLRSEDGSGTIEFVLAFPFVFTLFLSSVELGVTMTRQIMLDRALDLAVRDVRLGILPDVNRNKVVDQDDLVSRICAVSMYLPECRLQLKLEMIVANPRAWTTLDATPDCIDRSKTVQPARNFQPGAPNQLLVLRACMLFNPYFPSTGLGAELRTSNGGSYALASTSAFVIEPN